MSVVSQSENARDKAACLARSVAQAFDEDPTLEAVTIDRTSQTISVATLGKADVPLISERIRYTIQRAQTSDVSPACKLLGGKGNCQNCIQPLSEEQRHKIR